MAFRCRHAACSIEHKTVPAPESRLSGIGCRWACPANKGHPPLCAPPAFRGMQSKPALPALERLIHSQDDEVLTDACWALSYLSDGTNDKIQAVIEANVCGRLVELLL